MNISQVQINAQDPKAKTAISGTITQILGQENTDYGICQTVVCDGITAAFWPGKGGQPLTQADLNKPTEFMCKARTYQNQMQYSLSRPRTGGGGYRGKSPEDYAKDRQCRNRGIALSFALEHLKCNWPAAAKEALEMYEFMESGQLNIPEPHKDIQETEQEGQKAEQEDDIPF